jgi:hypothetical protein
MHKPTTRGLSVHNVRLLLLSSAACMACGYRGETVYTRTQKEAGLAMTAPIQFTVRLRVDTAERTVTWLEDSEDAEGRTFRILRKYGGVEPYSSCEIFDSENWTCTVTDLLGNGKTLELPAMKDGKLTRFYWTKTETYLRKFKFRGITF